MAAGLFFGLSVTAFSQDQQQSHVRLPPAWGGTPASFQIQAEASYVEAYGDMLQSAAIARKINAQAVALELDNSIAYVKAYFERQRINREERAKLNPDANKMEAIHQKARHDFVVNQVERILREKGDLSETLNWLLGELVGPTLACQYLPQGESLSNSKLDQQLSREDLKMIRLTDGGHKNSRLEFSVADGKVLETHWPWVLRSPEFDGLRNEFDKSRESLLKEATAGQVSDKTAKTIYGNVNSFMVTLDEVFPRERRADPKEFLTYASGKHFLSALLANVQRAITTNDQSVFSGRLAFQGKSLVELIQHMYQTGTEFAPPEPGGEAAYRKLLEGMRNLYMNIGPDRSDKPADANKS
jgi:hypothetical protein